jgi:hypothetical protein
MILEAAKGQNNARIVLWSMANAMIVNLLGLMGQVCG